MSPSDQPDDSRAAPWWRHMRPMRAVLAACALVLGGLVAAGLLAPLAALMGAATILAAALLSAVLQATQEKGPSAVRTNSVPVLVPGHSHDIIGELIAALPDPVAVLDAEGLVVALNARAVALAPTLRRGASASFALRMPAVVEAIRRAVATGVAQRAEFSERVPVDRWFEAHVVPMRQAGGRPLVLVAFHDLTPLRRVEEMRADFVANASHELRTPLASLSGFIDTLQGAARDDATARHRFLAIMKEQAQRMARLIDDLLSLSRIELNAHIHPDTSVDLVGAVRQVVDGLQMLARDRQVEIAVTAPERLPVLGDHDELVRVFENLIENALKYGGSGRRVDVEIVRADAAEGRPGEARVAVRDYGPGIPPEHLPRLTERFYRVDVGHSRAEGGTGLGLALVKHIVSRHRGRLSIESVQGVGSTFVVYLPLAPGQISSRSEKTN